MARLTPPTTPFYSSSSTKTTASSRSSGGGGGSGSGFTLIHSINSFLAKFKKSAKKMASPNSQKSSPAKRKGPKHLLLTFSNKGGTFKQKKKSGRDDDSEEFVDDDEGIDFGDGGLWQRSILLGDKCQPLDFSGVIYYDNSGKQLPEFPMRSPCASPLPIAFFSQQFVFISSKIKFIQHASSLKFAQPSFPFIFLYFQSAT